MNVKQLREDIDGIPDDATVRICLDPSRTELDIEDIQVLYSTGAKLSNDPADAEQVTLWESPDDSRPFEDQVRLGLPVEFVRLCTELGVSPEKLLHGFIADLCELQGERPDGLRSNGSDERRLAAQYVDRCGYGRRSGGA